MIERSNIVVKPQHHNESPMDSLLKRDALSLAQLYAAGEISPVEVTEVALARQTEIDALLNTSYIQTPELALEQARLSEKRWWAGGQLSALDGIPTTIKDGLWWRGHPVYRGFAGNREASPCPAEDAPVTARMRDAGMVFLGKTTMPDFGMLASGYSSHHGITRNPRNPQRTPGGSSSGAAAAVAAGAYPVVVGTDIVGSIRLPASFCGLFGLKPSQGRVPYYPPASPALVAGPITRNVADAAALMDIIAQPDRRDFTALPADTNQYKSALEAPPGKMKLGVLSNLGLGVPTDPEVAEAVYAAARTLQQAGHTLIEVDTPLVPEDLAAGATFYRQRVYTEMTRKNEEQQRRSPYLHQWITEGTAATGDQVFAANERLWDIRARLSHLFSNIDYLLCPAVPYPAFDADLPAPDCERLFDPWAHVFIFNLSEQPASSINCGVTSDGLPIGLQIVGQRFDDLGVLQLSRQFEQLSDHRLPVAENFLMAETRSSEAERKPL